MTTRRPASPPPVHRASQPAQNDKQPAHQWTHLGHFVAHVGDDLRPLVAGDQGVQAVRSHRRTHPRRVPEPYLTGYQVSGIMGKRDERGLKARSRPCRVCPSADTGHDTGGQPAATTAIATVPWPTPTPPRPRLCPSPPPAPAWGRLRVVPKCCPRRRWKGRTRGPSASAPPPALSCPPPAIATHSKGAVVR